MNFSSWILTAIFHIVLLPMIVLAGCAQAAWSALRARLVPHRVGERRLLF